MKTYTEIQQADKSYLYIIKDGDNRIQATEVYNSISMGYMGLKLEIWDDNIQWLYRNRELIENLWPDTRKELEKAGYSKAEPTETEILIYAKYELS